MTPVRDAPPGRWRRGEFVEQGGVAAWPAYGPSPLVRSRRSGRTAAVAPRPCVYRISLGKPPECLHSLAQFGGGSGLDGGSGVQGTSASAQCPVRALRVRRMAALRMSHPHLLAHEFQILASSGDFQPARWTVAPAPAGTMCHHAGKIRQRQLLDAPFLRALGMFWPFPDRVRPGPARVADRTSEPGRRLDREPPRGSVFTVDMWHGGPSHPHSARAAGPCAQPGETRQPHPHLLAHEFQKTCFIWEYSGFREEFGYQDAQSTPRSPNPPRYEVPRRARAARQPQVPAPAPGNDRKTIMAGNLTPACITAPGDACRQPRRSELDHRFYGQPPPKSDVFTLGACHWSARIHRGARIHRDKWRDRSA
jgi:hypothetical protein